MKGVAIVIICSVLLSCKNHTKNAEHEAIKDSVILEKLTNEKLQENDLARIFNLPFGPKELLTTKFPRDTVIVFGYNMKERPRIDESLNKITEYFQIFNLWSAEDSTRIKNFQNGPRYISDPNSYNYYDKPLISEIKKSEEDSSLFYCRPFDYFVQSGNLKANVNFRLVFNTTFPKYYGEDIQSANCPNYVANTDLVVLSPNGQIADAINIHCYTIEPYDTFEKYSYIDENLKISQYTLVGGETYQFIRKEQWQIKPNGRFVRYYENNGAFENDEEKGFVLNTMREGKWIEKKPNGFVNKKTYLEAEYKDGEPIGEMKYYSMENDFKTTLLYIETYKNGEMVKREFVND